MCTFCVEDCTSLDDVGMHCDECENAGCHDCVDKCCDECDAWLCKQCWKLKMQCNIKT